MFEGRRHESRRVSCIGGIRMKGIGSVRDVTVSDIDQESWKGDEVRAGLRRVEKETQVLGSVLGLRLLR